MPAPPGMDPGEAPPAAPRSLPKGFEFRQLWSQNVWALVGGIFFLIGMFIFLVFIFVLPMWALIPLLFIVGGAIMMHMGRKKAHGVLNAFRHGVTVQGSVSSVNLNTSQSINGRHPWVMTYLFPVGNEMLEGTLSSFSSALEDRARGQPLWVLYVENDPDQNTVYPPIR